MSKKTKKIQKNETEITLYEKVNVDILERLICTEELEENIKNQLRMYYNKRKENIVQVKYSYSKFLKDKGRLYAQGSLSLQNFKKEIRHALADGNYYDIDMENCHPRLILQYCKKNGIEHKILEKYVEEREEILNKVMKFHNIERNESKKLILRLCYLGGYMIEKTNEITQEKEDIEPPVKFKFLLKFQEELKKIATSISEIEKETYELVKKEESKINKKSVIMSITAQVLEHKCLMEMYNYFTHKGYKVGVLCFDGLMVEKSNMLINKLDEELRECEAYVKKKTNYEISLSEKEMDTKLTYKLPEFSEYVGSDRECQQKLFKIEGQDKFKYCKGQLYIFNETTGMFETSIETLIYYFSKNSKYLNIITKPATENSQEKVESYGNSSVLLHRTIPFVKAAAKDEKWLDKTEKTSIGYLLFVDGIYNMKTGEFKKGFDPKIVFHKQIPWKFPRYDKKEIKYAMQISFEKIFIDPKPMIAALSCALAGEVRLKKFYLCPGKPNAGKSKLADMLQTAFGNYVGEFNAESLAYTSQMDTKDEAAKMRWALLSRFCRILLSNEVNMKKKLNANDIKKHSSGGDKLVGRTHQKEEIGFKPQYTLFCMLNDIPEIVPMDEATMKRLTYIEFPHVFVEKNEVNDKKNYKEMDPLLDDKIQDEKFINGFIHIILDGYKNYLENGMPEFDQEVKNNWTTGCNQNNQIIEAIKENFEITGNKNDKVNIRDLKKFRENNREIFSTISLQRFNEILKEVLNLEEGRDSTARFWKGIKKINNNDFD